MTKIDVFCVGGGGGGGLSYRSTDTSFNHYDEIGGRGGGGGYTSTVLDVDVTPGQVLNIVVGSGTTGQEITYSYNDRAVLVNNIGSASFIGGTSSVGSICSANGGYGGGSFNTYDFSNNKSIPVSSGGCGGGDCGWYCASDSKWMYVGGNGGEDGSNGCTCKNYQNQVIMSDIFIFNKGQGTTTRYFGETTGTLYAGGGGGADGHNGGGGIKQAGTGGGGGGGNGLFYDNTNNGADTYGVCKNNCDGAANTGGGGGGDTMAAYDWRAICSAGGSGICIIRWGGYKAT